jgi:hypothetical protein
VNDLANQIAVMNRITGFAISALPALTAAGYPGNRRSLVSVRQNLLIGKRAGDAAQQDIAAAKSIIGI